MQPRRARPDDVPALVGLRAQMFTSMGTDPSDPLWRANAERWFAERIDDPSHCMLVLELDGQVVCGGTAMIRDAAPSPGVPQGRDIVISNICTLPPYRGRGCARRVFDALLGWARSTGVTRVELYATADGRPMYEAAGFTESRCPAMRCSIGS